MNIELLKKSNTIIFETIAGSISYGTNTPQSDTDIRGIFRLPKGEVVTIRHSVYRPIHYDYTLPHKCNCPNCKGESI